MSTAGVVAACIFALIYLEKVLKNYSVIAWVAFPITLAIIFANSAAERM